MAPPVVLVMGVAGSGKSTVGRALAAALGWDFQEGDDLHPPENVARMRAGVPLTDADRAPWLAAIGGWIDGQAAKAAPGVITCSALKQRYRDALTRNRRQVRIVYLRGSPRLMAGRMAGRAGHFMPASLLESQFATLEEPAASENVLTVDAAQDVDRQVAEIVRRIAPPVATGPRRSADRSSPPRSGR